MADYDVAAVGEKKVKQVPPPPLWGNDVQASSKPNFINSVWTAFGDTGVSTSSYQ